MAESLAGKMVFALIFLPLFSFPAKLAALKAPVSKLEGRFGGFFISLHWTKPVHRPGVKFLDGQWDIFFFRSLHKTVLVPNSLPFIVSVAHRDPFSLHLPHSSSEDYVNDSYHFLLPSLPNLFVYSHLFLA